MTTVGTRKHLRGVVLACTALTGALGTSQALAQAAADKTHGNEGLQEIVVTAQRRAQNLQDVPVAVTAVTVQALKTNRITNVTDLQSLAPNVSVTPAAGSVGLPFFGIRGLLANNNAAGQDKAIPIYLDGVPLGSADGLTFDLPDIERIEVLRGPQGTLFGRNSTAGAISITSRDPSGVFHADQTISVGNYNQIKSVTRIETPTFGPFSASISYTHDSRDGDIKNLGAGTVWDYSAVGLGRQVSPKTLGAHDINTVFAALKFDPGSNFKAVYKFQWTENNYTPDGEGLGVFTPCVLGCTAAGDGFGDVVRAIVDGNNNNAVAGFHRPNAVNNGDVIPSYQKVFGHNLTMTLRAADHLTIKNITGYRTSFIRSDSDLSGIGGLTFPQSAVPTYTNFLVSVGVPAAFAPFVAQGEVGKAYYIYFNNVQNRSKQFSDELQFNYDSKLLTLTAGGLYFHLNEQTGAPAGLPSTPSFTSYVNNTIPVQPRDNNIAKEDSYAGYAQAEVHLTRQLDVIGGVRVTRDVKNGANILADVSTPVHYAKTEPTFSVGANYKPTQDILAYAKYSTGFVSGGQINRKTYDEEKVKSTEVGLKTDWLDHRLRLNLTGFIANYTAVNSPEFASSGLSVLDDFGNPVQGLYVASIYDLKTKGVEVEASAAPFRGFTLNGGFGYTAWDVHNVRAGFEAANIVVNIPHYTANVAAQYRTEPVFGDARFLLSLDANWRSSEVVLGLQPQFLADPAYLDKTKSPAGWVLNGRLALQDIALPHAKLEFAVWAKNIANSDRPTYPVYFTFSQGVTYEAARTFGLDVSVHF